MDDFLVRGIFETNFAIAEKACKEIDYSIKQLGDLSSPSPDVVRYIVKQCTNVEDKTGFLFFLRAFGYMPHPTKGKIRLGLNLDSLTGNIQDGLYFWQKAAAIQYLTGTKFISKKVRQVGATTFTSAYFLWRSLFYSNTVEYILSLGVRESSEVLSRITFMYDNLPTWLKTPLLEGAKTSIMFKNNSKVKALPGTPDATRGSSLSAALIDELAFLRKADLILSAVGPALSMGFLTPFTNHSLPSQMFLISTFPLMETENNEYVRIYKKAIEGNSDFSIIPVVTDDIPEYNDEKWLKSMLETLGPKKYSVEILGTMNSTLDNSFLPEHIVESLEAIPPMRTDFLKPDQVDEEGYAVDMDRLVGAKENYDKELGYIKSLWIWSDPLPGAVYGIAVDVSTGTGGDYSTIQVFHVLSGDQVAEYKNNKVSLEDFKEIIIEVAKYYNNALLSVENNSMGSAICSWIGETVQYENFYRHRKSKNNYSLGFPVSSGNRGSMLASLQSAFSKKEVTIKSIRTINEIRSFGYAGNGRITGLNGAHDDLVMSLAQYCYLRETFFVTEKPEDWGEEFLQAVNQKEEEIRSRHFMNGLNFDIDERKSEALSLIEGYSINLQELKKWGEERIEY